MNKKINKQLMKFPEYIVKKAENLISIVNNDNWSQFGHKIERSTLISIPVTDNVRIVYNRVKCPKSYKDKEKELTFMIKLLGVFSHDDYDKLIMR